MVKRRQRQNYLAYTEPFDLNILLDEAYWNRKGQLVAHSPDEIARLSALNKLYELGHFEGGPLHEFLDFKESVESEAFKVKHLFWQNSVDAAVPYQSGFKQHFWNVSKVVINKRIFNTEQL